MVFAFFKLKGTKPTTSVKSVIFYFAALFISSKSSRHSTPLSQQQATGRHEYLDRRAEGRLFQNLPSRSENV